MILIVAVAEPFLAGRVRRFFAGVKSQQEGCCTATGAWMYKKKQVQS